MLTLPFIQNELKVSVVYADCPRSPVVKFSP